MAFKEDMLMKIFSWLTGKKRESLEFPRIPMAFNEDMLMEIFSWLPGKSLSKFSLVSRSVGKLLSDDFFIRKQSRNMRFLGDSDFFVQSYGYHETLQLHGNYSEVNQSTSLLPCKADEFMAGFGPIWDSFNGLICSRKDERGPLFLFNPATRSYMQVPAPVDGLFNILFAGEARGSLDDYMLLSVIPQSEWGGEYRFRVFVPSEKMWKDLAGVVDFGGRNMAFADSVQLRGVIYFVSDSGQTFAGGSQFFWPYIVAYDIKDHTAKFLKIPKNARRGSWDSDLAIFKWGRPRLSDDDRSSTICLVRFWRKKFTIWALSTRIDSATSYWKRVFHRRIKSMGLNDFDKHMGISYSVLNGTTLLLVTEQKVYSYNLLDGAKAKIQELCEHDFCGARVRFYSFSSTLSRCGPDHAVIKSFDM